MRFQEIRKALRDLDQETQKSNTLAVQGRSSADRKYWLWNQIQHRQGELRVKIEGLFAAALMGDEHKFDNLVEDIETEAIILWRYYRKHEDAVEDARS